MKKKEGLVLRVICGQNVITAEGLQQVNFSKMVSLNETAAYLWKSVGEEEFTARTLADLLLEQYEVDEETALYDSENLCRLWLESGIIEE